MMTAKAEVGMGDRPFRAFHDEDGFTSIGVVVALLVTLSLIFTTAQVYQVNSAASEIQEVADASALAAENVVAEYLIIAHVCDAAALSLSLTGIAEMGLGAAALCTPATAPLSAGLIENAHAIFRARDVFVHRAASGLEKLQAMLPFLAAAQAEAVIAANSGGRFDSSYFGLAILLPGQGERIDVQSLDSADDLVEDVERNRDRIEADSLQAEQRAQKANAAKMRAFEHDCGASPAYCMHERAETLAGMSGSDNPLYRSMDAWSFSVALERAKAYYPWRAAHEVPLGASIEEKADSVLRLNFYRYASEAISQGFVVDDGNEVFEANFPLLPKNTEEMRATSLYTEAAYPMTRSSSGSFVMHAWDGCPSVASSQKMGMASIAQGEAEGFEACPLCEFGPSSMGRVASASSSIENGFEYHYRIVAEAAQEYEQARADFAPFAAEAKGLFREILASLQTVLSDAVSQRIEVFPPGRFGAVSVVADIDRHPVSDGFSSGFVKEGASLGLRAAISAATLVPDSSEASKTIVSSLLDGYAREGGFGVDIVDSVFDLWSCLLFVYARGQGALVDGVESALDALPLASASGLGTWAAARLLEAIESVGLQPAKLDALKPVILNSNHVLGKDESGFSRKLLSVKSKAAGLGGAEPFSAALSLLEKEALSSIEDLGDGIEIASIEVLGEGGPSIPITVALPSSIIRASEDGLSNAIDRLRGIAATLTGVRQWG